MRERERGDTQRREREGEQRDREGISEERKEEENLSKELNAKALYLILEDLHSQIGRETKGKYNCLIYLALRRCHLHGSDEATEKKS